jgi:hypothetical protein
VCIKGSTGVYIDKARAIDPTIEPLAGRSFKKAFEPWLKQYQYRQEER